MSEYPNQNTLSMEKRVTLSSLKEQFYTLNMRMLLAIQNHDGETQEEIKKQMEELNTKMNRLSLDRRL